MTTALQAPPYGRDTSATSRVFFGRMSSGLQLIAEALFRRFITRRGSLESDPNYGLALVEWLQSNDPTAGNVLALQTSMRSEALKDERVDDVVVSIVASQVGVGVELDITIDVTADTGDTFSMALHVDDVTVALLSIDTGAA